MIRIQSLYYILFLSSLYSLVAADDGSQSSSAPPVSTTSAAASNNMSGVQGDKQCPGSQLMCVTGIVNGSTVTYELQSTGSSLGWMAIGFGSQMADTPMVIMWPNTDGTITLSQREAPAEVMPTPVASPTNVASAATPLSTLTGSKPVLAFTIAGSAKQQSLIWAFGTTRPGADASSTLQQHLDSGTFTLDLTKTLSSNNVTTPSGPGHIPFLPYEKMIIAHAVVVTFGFLFVLPGGVLLARYTRTISPRWYTGHWILQLLIGGPFVVVGCTLGFMAHQQGATDTTTDHKSIGTILLALYVVQCTIGAFIHYVKLPFRVFGRPPQNYFHALFGLGIIALALYQVYIGFSAEWPDTTGRGRVDHSVTIAWAAWAVVLVVLYSGGLAYLPRQWKQEREGGKPSEQYRLTSYSDSQED